MDIEALRKRIADFADTSSAYHVIVEVDEGTLYDDAVLGVDALSILANIGVALLTGYTTHDELPPTGRLVVRITPVAE